MAYVLLTADAGYEPHGHRSTSELVSEWAYRADGSDGSATYLSNPLSGGRLRHLNMPYTASQPRTLLKRYYDSASAFSDRGEVGISMGHGHSNPSGAWVDLAPAGMYRIGTDDLSSLVTRRDAREPRTDRDEFVELLGERFRVSGVRRVDFYSCSVGVGEPGQELLDAFHRVWQVPTRGLRGTFHVEGHLIGGGLVDQSQPIRVRVMPAPGASARRGHGRWFDGLVTAPGLWRTSRRRRH